MKSRKPPDSRFYIVVFAVIFITAITVFLVQRIDRASPTTYEECAALRSSVILESYPPVCMTEDGKRFIPMASAADVQTNCEQNNGKWATTYQECEGVSKQTCEQAGGIFDECASPCRNDPDYPNVFCMQVCVAVCAF